MRAPYYSTPERKHALSMAAARWVGTPFRYGSRVAGIGGGVDCVNLTAAVHEETGATGPVVTPPDLPLNWHLHHAESGIVAYLRSDYMRERVQHIDRDEAPAHGDLIAVQSDLCVHHLGTFLDDALGKHLLHVPVNRSVQRHSLESKMFLGRIVGIWRPLEIST